MAKRLPLEGNVVNLSKTTSGTNQVTYLSINLQCHSECIRTRSLAPVPEGGQNLLAGRYVSWLNHSL